MCTLGILSPFPRQALLETLNGEITIRPGLGATLASSIAAAAKAEAPDDTTFHTGDYCRSLAPGWESEAMGAAAAADDALLPLRGSDLLLLVCSVSGGSGSCHDRELRGAIVRLVNGCRHVRSETGSNGRMQSEGRVLRSYG